MGIDLLKVMQLSCMAFLKQIIFALSCQTIITVPVRSMTNSMEIRDFLGRSFYDK